MNAALNGVMRTSTMAGDNSKSLENAGLALAPNLIQSLDPGGFTIGSANDVNQAGQVHHWVAFKAAAGQLKVGTYVGNNTDNTSITGVGFQPEVVMTFPATALIPEWTSSTLPADTSFDFDSTQIGPNDIQAFQADGFQVGNDPNLNAAGVTFHYIAWNAVPGRMAVGTYTGNGADNRNLDVAGFFPEWVIVKKFPDGGVTRAPMHKSASTGVGTDVALRFADVASLPNTIQTLRPLGFQVGSDDRVNDGAGASCGVPACTYHWIAFGPHQSQTNYRSIGTRPRTARPAGGAGTTITVTAGSPNVSGAGAPPG